MLFHTYWFCRRGFSGAAKRTLWLPSRTLFLVEYAGNIFLFVRRMKQTRLDLFSVWEQEINFENDLNVLPGEGLLPL